MCQWTLPRSLSVWSRSVNKSETRGKEIKHQSRTSAGLEPHTAHVSSPGSDMWSKETVTNVKKLRSLFVLIKETTTFFLMKPKSSHSIYKGEDKSLLFSIASDPENRAACEQSFRLMASLHPANVWGNTDVVSAQRQDRAGTTGIDLTRGERERRRQRCYEIATSNVTVVWEKKWHNLSCKPSTLTVCTNLLTGTHNFLCRQCVHTENIKSHFRALMAKSKKQMEILTAQKRGDYHF